MVPCIRETYPGIAGLTAREERVMGVQTNLRAGGSYGSCCNCGSLIYIENNVNFNVQLGLVNFNSQHND
jgi:hypothetical protein